MSARAWVTGHAVRVAAAALFAIALGGGLAGCSDVGEGDPMPTVGYVDLNRFMGDWYVVAGIVTSGEEDAYNPIETYERVNDTKIATTFTYNKGSFDGKVKTMKPKGTIVNTRSNAEWAMKFGPLKFDYRIIYLNDDYDTTVIGRNKRDLVWIMSRTPSIDEAEYAEIMSLLEAVGYDTAEVRQMPHEATATAAR